MKEVFPREKNGYLWTTVHLSGTIQAPQQDLSVRIMEAIKEHPTAMLKIFFRRIGESLRQAFDATKNLPNGPARCGNLRNPKLEARNNSDKRSRAREDFRCHQMLRSRTLSEFEEENSKRASVLFIPPCHAVAPGSPKPCEGGLA